MIGPDSEIHPELAAAKAGAVKAITILDGKAERTKDKRLGNEYFINLYVLNKEFGDIGNTLMYLRGPIDGSITLKLSYGNGVIGNLEGRLFRVEQGSVSLAIMPQKKDPSIVEAAEFSLQENYRFTVPTKAKILERGKIIQNALTDPNNPYQQAAILEQLARLTFMHPVQIKNLDCVTLPTLGRGRILSDLF